VVVLSGVDASLPALRIIDDAMRSEIQRRSRAPVEFFAEAFDLVRFSETRFEKEAAGYLKQKYRNTRVHVIVAAQTNAFDFVRTYKSEIWPAAAVVFHSVDVDALKRRELDSLTTGVAVDQREAIAKTIDLALRLRPAARRIIVVGGTSPIDRMLQSFAREALARLPASISVEYRVDEALADLVVAAAAFPPDAVLLALTVYHDGAGELRVPREAFAKVAAASSIPVFAPFETFVGHGAVGGVSDSFPERGRSVGALVARVLNGEAPGSIVPRVQLPPPPVCVVDFSQIERWGIDERLLPSTCEVRFRTPGAWETHRWQIVTAAAVLLMQTVLIAALVLQRSRRRRAEHAVERQRVELAHAARLASMGELTAVIAHEVNQPLGAIMANVAAAEMALASGDGNLEEVRQILADVRKDDKRASEAIRRLRSLLAKNEMTPQRVDINEAIQEIVQIVAPEARRRGIAIETDLSESPLPVIGDRVHIQQVLLNLIINAMDAMADTPAARRRVRVRSARSADGGIELTVADHGHGIASSDMARLFDSFFTTKQHGMGLGLSIARSILEAHGGRIWARSDGAAGATFHVVFPEAAPGHPSFDAGPPAATE
jgi:signal transduction histidine kinase